MAYSLSPLLKPRFFVNATNKPLVGGKLYTYLAETTTPATTYSNDTGTPNTNPIILDANGECNLYLDDDKVYRLILKDANDVTYFDKDRVSSIGGGDYKVLTFDTIADLRLKIGSEKEPVAQTSGYYAAGDGGGNSFYWDGTSSEDDNGGTIIKPTFVSGAGRWLALNKYSFSVAQFGAYGDGEHNDEDEEAINRAITALSPDGAVLYFDGIYKLPENTEVTTKTYFSIQTSGVTLVFSSRTKFLIKSNSANAIVFALAGISFFKTIGVLHIESDATTPYSSSGQYGAKAIQIYNANGASSEHITIDKVVLKRGSGGVFIVNAYAASNRVTNISIGEIRTYDATYGFNAQNNGDGVDIGLVYTYNAFRSYFVYGCESHRAKVLSRSPNTGGTPVNLTTYSVAEGGSGINTDDITIDLTVSNGGNEVSIASIRNIGDGGASQKVSNIRIRIYSDYKPSLILSLYNFSISGGSTTSTPFNAKIENIYIEDNTPLATYPIAYDPCSWVVKPNIVWQGMSAATMSDILEYEPVIDFNTNKNGVNYFQDGIILKNNIPVYGLSSSGTSKKLAYIDTSDNTHYGEPQTSATYSAIYSGSNGVYFSVNGASRFQARSSSFVPYTDNGYSLGISALRWSVVYAGTGTINTSDERLKQQITSDLSPEIRAWSKVNFCKYKFNDAVEAKGDKARWHFGVIAQQVKEAFESEGLDPFAYGILCYDEWDEEEEVLGDDGAIISEKKEAGSRYGIRYEEALILECAYLRSRR